jgi:hypothetical protein
VGVEIFGREVSSHSFLVVCYVFLGYFGVQDATSKTIRTVLHLAMMMMK